MAHLIVRRLGDETLVYDRESNRAHCLSREASLVFSACDGRTPPGWLARKLQSELRGLSDMPTAGLVECALEQLAGAGLLEESPALDARLPGELSSRRAALRTLASTSVLPLVLSIVAPTPATALTCIPKKGTCTSSSECCPDAPCCRPRGNRPPECGRGGGNCIP
jgi:hypothetical protein